MQKHWKKKRRKEPEQEGKSRAAVASSSFSLSYSLSLFSTIAARERRRRRTCCPFPSVRSWRRRDPKEKRERREREREKQPVTAEKGPFTAKKGISLWRLLPLDRTSGSGEKCFSFSVCVCAWKCGETVIFLVWAVLDYIFFSWGFRSIPSFSRLGRKGRGAGNIPGKVRRTQNYFLKDIWKSFLKRN